MQLRRDRQRPRASRVPALIVALLIALAGCGEQSRVDADAPVQLTGAAVGVDGQPLANRPVRLGSGVTDLEGAAGFFTIGMFCLGGDCRGDTFDTTTDDEGRFRYDLTGADTQSSFGEAASFLVSTSAAPNGDHPIGAGVGARFRIQTEDLRLPGLQLVDPELALGSDGARVVLQWDGAAAPGPYTARFVDTSGVAVWLAERSDPALGLDGRILEDTTGVVAVEGGGKDRVEGSDLEIRWWSPALAFRGGFGVPPSRGADCEAVGEDGSVEPLRPCPLTDGALVETGLPSIVCVDRGAEGAGRCSPLQRVRLHLPAPVTADLVVVRGCDSTCRVSTATPGSATGTDRGAVTGRHAALGLDGSAVELVELVGLDAVDTLTEVSVWAPAPADATPLLTVDDPAEVAGPLADEAPSDEGGSGWLTAGAVAAVAVVLVGLGVLIGRRSRAG